MRYDIKPRRNTNTNMNRKYLYAIILTRTHHNHITNGNADNIIINQYVN